MLTIVVCTLCVCRCVWSDRRDTHWEPTREVTVRSRGVREDSVPRSTDALRQTPATTSFTPYCLRSSYRTAVLRTTRRQDSNWYSHQRHAAQRRLLQLAVHAHTMTVDQSQRTSSGHVTRRKRHEGKCTQKNRKIWAPALFECTAVRKYLEHAG